jgi:hypothetical protein
LTVDVWVSYVVAAQGAVEPDRARATTAVIDGWDCWLLPARPRTDKALIGPGEAGIEATLVAFGEGYGSTYVRNQLGGFGIKPVAGGDGFRVHSLAIASERFIKGLGSRGVRRATVHSMLQQTWPTQLHAFHGVLSSLRLARRDTFDSRDFLCGHELDDPDLPAVFRSDPRPSTIRAIALDHDSPAWHGLVATQDLYDYGQPVDGSTYLTPLG